MKLSLLLLIVPIFILTATFVMPSTACEYEINRACNLTLEGIEAKPITSTKGSGAAGLMYLTIRIQNKSDCQFNNVKIIYTLRGSRNEAFTSGEFDAGKLGPYECRTEAYRVRDLAISPGTSGLTCDLSLEER